MPFAWAPTLGANLYDFHIEAFLPVEIFAFVWLWNRGRYRAGFLVGALSFATMELTPILLFAIGVFFLWPEIKSLRRFAGALGAPRRWASAARSASQWFVSSPSKPSLQRAPPSLRGGVHDLGLFLRQHYLTVLLGVPAFPTVNRGYVIGGSPGELGLLLQNVGSGWPTKVLMWVILLALLGFIPLLAPRALLLSVPWVVFTFLSAKVNYVVIGWQYGFVEGAGLLVAFVFGQNELARRWRKHADSRILALPSAGTMVEPRLGAFRAAFLPEPSRARLARGRLLRGALGGQCRSLPDRSTAR